MYNRLYIFYIWGFTIYIIALHIYERFRLVDMASKSLALPRLLGAVDDISMCFYSLAFFFLQEHLRVCIRGYAGSVSGDGRERSDDRGVLLRQVSQCIT